MKQAQSKMYLLACSSTGCHPETKFGILFFLNSYPEMA